MEKYRESIAAEVKRFTAPCPADGVEHHCSYEFIEAMPVETFWYLVDKAVTFDRNRPTVADLNGPGWTRMDGLVGLRIADIKEGQK